MGDARKQSLMSTFRNLEPIGASEMVLLMSSLVSRILVAGDPVSKRHYILSLPTTTLIRCCSAFNGLKSNTKVA